jgi:hypothetical protein
MFGVVACVQEVAVTPGELLADAYLIHYTMGASEKDEEEVSRIKELMRMSYQAPFGMGGGLGQKAETLKCWKSSSRRFSPLILVAVGCLVLTQFAILIPLGRESPRGDQAH